MVPANPRVQYQKSIWGCYDNNWGYFEPPGNSNFGLIKQNSQLKTQQ